MHLIDLARSEGLVSDRADGVGIHHHLVQWEEDDTTRRETISYVELCTTTWSNVNVVQRDPDLVQRFKVKTYRAAGRKILKPMSVIFVIIPMGIVRHCCNILSGCPQLPWTTFYPRDQLNQNKVYLCRTNNSDHKLKN